MTRLYIHTDSKKQPRFFLPWDYHLSFQSFIYQAIGEYEPEVATELHQLKHDPPFSFSNFIQTGPYTPYNDGMSCTRGYWIFNSDRDEIVNAVSNYAEQKNLKLGHTQIPVISTDVEPVEGYSGTKTYESVSPAAVGEFPYDGNGTREWYIGGDAMWISRIRESTINRMMHELDRSREDVRFKIKNIEWSDKKVKRVKDKIRIPCTRYKITADTDSTTDRFIRMQGIGEKTGQGFGTTVKNGEIPERWS